MQLGSWWSQPIRCCWLEPLPALGLSRDMSWCNPGGPWDLVRLSNLPRVAQLGSRGLVWIRRPRLSRCQRKEDGRPCIDTSPSLALYLCSRESEPESLEPEAHRADHRGWFWPHFPGVTLTPLARRVGPRAKIAKSCHGHGSFTCTVFSNLRSAFI